MIGFHPEGTRNQGADPYELLPAKPGCGEVIYRANPNVVPVFLQGFPRNLLKMLRGNGDNATASKPLVHMVMGDPIDLREELKMEDNNKTYLRISQTVMAKINDLAQREKEIRKSFEK